MILKSVIGVSLFMLLSSASIAAPSPSPNCGVAGSTESKLLKTALPQPAYYPALSILLNEQGNTLVDVLVDPNGKSVDSTVVQSAGTERLDNASLAMANAATFQPATFDGKAITCHKQLRVAWTLTGVQGTSALNVKQMGSDEYPFQARTYREEGVAVVIVGIDEDGKIASTLVVHSSGYPALDTASVDYIRTHGTLVPAKISGIAVKTMVAIAFDWSLSNK